MIKSFNSKKNSLEVIEKFCVFKFFKINVYHTTYVKHHSKDNRKLTTDDLSCC